MKAKFCVLLALGLLCFCSASASTIVFTTIAVPAGSGAVYNTTSVPGSLAFGGISINDSLEIVGSFNPTGSTYQGFTYNATTPGPGAFILPASNCTAPCTGFQQPVNGGLFAQTAPHGINNNGTSTGLYLASTTQLNGFVLGGSSDSTYGALANPSTTIDPNISSQQSNSSFFFNGIGNNGEIVGTYAGGGTTHGFTYTGGSGAADTGGSFSGSAIETTYSASTSPSSMYLCADSTTSSLGSSNNFQSVNSSGIVAGFCTVGTFKYGLTYNGSGYDLFTIAPISGVAVVSTEIFAIDDHGDIGGNYLIPAGAPNAGLNEAFYCTAAQVTSAISGGVNANGAFSLSGCTTYDANNVGALGLTDPLSSSFSQVYLWGINNNGDIVGTFTDTGGGTFAFVAEPPAVTGVPEPGTLVLFGVAGGALLLVRKRRQK